MLPEPNLTLGALIGAGWCAAVSSFWMARLLIRAAVLPDRPNERSSHKNVTPRAGGIAIFLAWFVATALIGFLFTVSETPHHLFAFALIASVAFAIGAIDDFFNLSAPVKLIATLIVAGIFVRVFGSIEVIPFPFRESGYLPLGVFAPLVTVLWIVGFMNAFNFMDGINGLAAATAAFAACALAIAAALAGAIIYAIAAIILAVAISGFLPANLRGRIFLGDNGSLSIGFVLATLAVLVGRESNGAVSFLFLPTVFAPFLFDVAFTLLHRARRKQKLMTAHREHLYQLAVGLGLSHIAVTAIYLMGVAFSSALAMGALSLPPSWQWSAPVLLFAAMTVPSIRLYERGQGLLAARPHGSGEAMNARANALTGDMSDDAHDGSVNHDIPQAAE